MLDEEHLLGAGREAGDRLCQFILEEDEIVAVLIWCAAAWHLQDRDTMIGWDPVTRSQRLKLVVQLRRFLVPEKSRRPNLASQSLGLALRELPDRWHTEHGYRPLMAESFSDPESHHGTVYKVTNWTCAGDTKGFSQDHTDYYLPNDRPKKLWLKPCQMPGKRLKNVDKPLAFKDLHRFRGVNFGADLGRKPRQAAPRRTPSPEILAPSKKDVRQQACAARC